MLYFTCNLEAESISCVGVADPEPAANPGRDRTKAGLDAPLDDVTVDVKRRRHAVQMISSLKSL